MTRIAPPRSCLAVLALLAISGCYSTPTGDDVSVLVPQTNIGFPLRGLYVDGRRIGIIGGPTKQKPIVVSPGQHSISLPPYQTKTIEVAGSSVYDLKFRDVRGKVSVTLKVVSPDDLSWGFYWRKVGLEPPAKPAKVDPTPVTLTMPRGEITDTTEQPAEPDGE